MNSLDLALGDELGSQTWDEAVQRFARLVDSAMAEMADGYLDLVLAREIKLVEEKPNATVLSAREAKKAGLRLPPVPN